MYDFPQWPIRILFLIYHNNVHTTGTQYLKVNEDFLEEMIISLLEIRTFSAAHFAFKYFKIRFIPKTGTYKWNEMATGTKNTFPS